MDPNIDTRNIPVPPEFSDGAKEMPQPQTQTSGNQPQSQAQNQTQPSSQVQQPTVDIEALKRDALARRQSANQPKKQEDYKKLFSKRYFLAVGILLIISVIVFGLIIIIHLTRS